MRDGRAPFFAHFSPEQKVKPKDETTPFVENLIRHSRHYAGIGSREAPRSALILIAKLATTLAHYGLTLRSGGSPGADTAFERGCGRAKGKKEIFLPWKGFNGNKSPFFEPPEQAEILASLHHPNWRACSRAARKLHARNCQQVCGLDMEFPVDFVLFWAPEKGGIVKGGTATAVSLAREMQIPTFNLWDEAIRETWKELVNVYEQRKRRFWKRVFEWMQRPANGEGRR